MKFEALRRKAEDPFLLGPRASGELWIYEEGRASTRRVPCFRGRDGTSLLGPRAGGELWIYEGRTAFDSANAIGTATRVH